MNVCHHYHSVCLFVVEVPFTDADVAKSLLISISNDIGQIAYLTAKLHQLPRIYFGGYFIRGHPMTMHTITYAINYWSQVSESAVLFIHCVLYVYCLMSCVISQDAW